MWPSGHRKQESGCSLCGRVNTEQPSSIDMLGLKDQSPRMHHLKGCFLYSVVGKQFGNIADMGIALSPIPPHSLPPLPCSDVLSPKPKSNLLMRSKENLGLFVLWCTDLVGKLTVAASLR